MTTYPTTLDDPKTFDLRLWIDASQCDPSAMAIDLVSVIRDWLDAAGYSEVEVRWITERKRRDGKPRIIQPKVGATPRDYPDDLIRR